MNSIYIGEPSDADYYRKLDDDFAFEAAVERLTAKGEEFYPFGPDNILEWIDEREGMVDDVAQVVRIAWENMQMFAKLPGAIDAMQRLSHDLESYWQKKAIAYINTPEPY